MYFIRENHPWHLSRIGFLVELLLAGEGGYVGADEDVQQARRHYRVL